MSSHFHCVSYSDVKATIRLDKEVIYLELKDKEGRTDIHITLNPIQVLTLAKYLYAMMSEIKLEDIYKSKLFGNLTVQIENANIDAEKFKIPDGCYNDEFYYYNEEMQVANA